jgi:hypothetical protein
LDFMVLGALTVRWDQQASWTTVDVPDEALLSKIREAGLSKIKVP